MKAGLEPSSLEDAFAHVRKKLQPITENPGLDARVLIAHTCGQDKGWVVAHPEYQLTPVETDQLAQNLEELLKGKPLPYVLGEWEFFGRRFKVTPDVLIPRPETELLVETAISWLESHPKMRSGAEAGAGSGCISISLAAAVSDLVITATEISPQAANIARENANQFEVAQRVSLCEDDLLTHQPGPFDMIVANLPYIPTDTLRKLPIYQREPTLALDGGPEGLDLIERLLAQAASRITAGGLILLEIESGQGNSALALAEHFFPKAHSHIKPDLAGHPRLLVVNI